MTYSQAQNEVTNFSIVRRRLLNPVFDHTEMNDADAALTRIENEMVYDAIKGEDNYYHQGRIDALKGIQKHIDNEIKQIETKMGKENLTKEPLDRVLQRISGTSNYNIYQELKNLERRVASLEVSLDRSFGR